MDSHDIDMAHRGCHFVFFQRTIGGNLNRREISFADQVRAIYGPIQDWDQKLEGDDPALLGPKGVLLNCDQLIDWTGLADVAPYPATEKPVFIGHYWLRGDRPELLAPNIACLDYSVAKGGYLCAYRWDGEQELSDEKFLRA